MPRNSSPNTRCICETIRHGARTRHGPHCAHSARDIYIKIQYIVPLLTQIYVGIGSLGGHGPWWGQPNLPLRLEPQSNSCFTKGIKAYEDAPMHHLLLQPFSQSNKMTHHFLSSVKHYLYIVHLNYVLGTCPNNPLTHINSYSFMQHRILIDLSPPQMVRVARVTPNYP